ncbi:histidine phosphatase family protein [Patescibacteria group bacterium]|nr:MAG: histidine phosphatase family protein [Patescibacteria group bacterium]
MSSVRPVQSSLRSSMTKTVYYVRHGLSQGNADGVTSGAEHDCDLTDEGRDQAKQAGQDLRDKHIDLVVCSPMKRTVETAEIIARELGYDAQNIVQRPEFIERYVGAYSGKPYQEYRDAIASGNTHESLETYQQMHDRISQGLAWIKQRPEKRIVIVSHGGAGRVMRAINQGLHFDDIYKVEGFKNTEIYEFSL